MVTLWLGLILQMNFPHAMKKLANAHESGIAAKMMMNLMDKLDKIAIVGSDISCTFLNQATDTQCFT